MISELWKLMSYFSSWIWSMALYPFKNLGPTIVSLVTGQSDPILGNNLVQFVKVDDGNALDGLILPVMESLMPVGYALCLLFFLISLLELAMSERMTMEYMIKFFSKFVVGVVAIYYCKDIYRICREMGAAMASWISLSAGQEIVIPDLEGAFQLYCEKGGGAAWLACVLGSLVGGAPCLFIGFGLLALTYITIFTWILEMGARAVFLPIALSLLSDDGWRGAGGRYIKKFLGICCQGAVMVIVASIMTRVMSAAMTGVAVAARNAANIAANQDIMHKMLGTTTGSFMLDLIQATVVVIGVGIASFSVMGKSMSIVSDVFGG